MGALSIGLSHNGTLYKCPITLLYYSTPCLKNCAKLFLSELRQIFTNFDNVWQKDYTFKAKIMPGAVIFHLT